MERYLNLNGTSNVLLYDIHDDYIDIVFNNLTDVYRYSYVRPGKDIVETMKKLAIRGYGLGGYIAQYVGADYMLKFPYQYSRLQF